MLKYSVMEDKTIIGGEEKIISDLLQQLKLLDLQRLASNKDLSIQSDGKVLLESLGRTYLVEQHGVTGTDGASVSSKQQLAVISYVLSEATGPPAFDYIPFSHLGGFNIGREQHFTKNVKQPLLDTFSDDYDLFAQAALKIGGIIKESDPTGKHVWLFHVFPNLLIQLIYYESDEDFSADVQILFDSRALDLLGMKCLGFLPGYFSSSLLKAAAVVK